MRRGILPVVLLAALIAGCARPAPPPPPAAPSLAGTSWQLVGFKGGDDTEVTPDDKSKYTLAFAPDGSLTARMDCNRGRGTWKSAAPGQVELGPMALTRAMCPPGSLHDCIVRHLPMVRSYVIRDGRLFLSLMADGGIYDFEPSVP
jgi:para-nitrobenzyl esterase